MKQSIYSIRDSKSEAYGPLFLANREAEAQRSFAQIANNKNSTIAQYPEDYDLYELGTFNETTGKIDALETPRHIIKAIHLKASPEVQA